MLQGTPQQVILKTRIEHFAAKRITCIYQVYPPQLEAFKIADRGCKWFSFTTQIFTKHLHDLV